MLGTEKNLVAFLNKFHSQATLLVKNSHQMIDASRVSFLPSPPPPLFVRVCFGVE